MLKNKIQTCQFITLSDLFDGYEALKDHAIETLTSVSFGDSNRTMITLEQILDDAIDIYEPDDEELQEWEEDDDKAEELEVWNDFKAWSKDIKCLDRQLYVDLEN